MLFIHFQHLYTKCPQVICFYFMQSCVMLNEGNTSIGRAAHLHSNSLGVTNNLQPPDQSRADTVLRASSLI